MTKFPLRAVIIAVLLLAPSLALHAQWSQALFLSKSAPSITIQSITPRSGTFASGVPNGTVATLTVTLSNGGNFTSLGGTLSITGANSGGFQVVGLVLKQSSSSGGTASGTYTDFSVVASMPGANPLSVSQSWVGSASTVPGPAQAAGFTNRVIHSDFSDAFHATIGNWFYCQGSTNPANPEWYEGWVGVFGNGRCDRYAIGTDGGTQVLKGLWQDSWWHSVNGEEGTFAGSARSDNGAGRHFKHYYFEVRFRVEQMQPDDFAFPPAMNLGFWGAGALSGSAPEWDLLEMYGQNGGITPSDGNRQRSDDCWHNPGGTTQADCLWDGSSSIYPPNVSPHPDFTQYHTMGMRVTSDGSSAVVYCAWFEGIPQGCQNVGFLTSGQLNGSNDDLTTVPQLLYMHVSGPGKPIGHQMVVDIQYADVWVCPSWSNSTSGRNCFTGQANP